MTKNRTRDLFTAIVEHDSAAASDAIKHGADPDAILDGVRPMQIATILGSREMIDLLLKNNANVNTADRIGRTALHWAALGSLHAEPDLIQVLLKAGADVNAPDAHGCTPLDLAAGAANRDAVTQLVAAGGTCKDDRRTWVQAISGPDSRSGASGRHRRPSR